MRERLWRRLLPGDDAIVEQFLARQVEEAHRELARANDWHRTGRHYVLDPPLPRGASPMMFDVDQVELRSVDRRYGTDRATWALITGLAASAAAAVIAWSIVPLIAKLIPA